MRRFHSYGPVIEQAHYCVPRTELVNRCVDQLIGSDMEEHGHYFTIWAPRQTGKTWLMEQTVEMIRRVYGDTYIVKTMSMQGVIMKEDDPADAFLERVPRLFHKAFGIKLPDAPANWETFIGLFDRESSDGSPKFDRPVILLIDEFDKLPQQVIDAVITLFRDLYLSPSTNWLHGLAMIGVRSVLGVESRRGSPFNVQRSVHIPNLTHAEVTDMFDQYRAESGQEVDVEVVDKLYDSTRGQPGLIGWFGELITEKYNDAKDQPLTMRNWRDVYAAAMQVEPNNTLLNLLAKARGEYQDRVLALYANPNTPFEFRAEWCNHLYMNGIIAPEKSDDPTTDTPYVCRFSSPFVQTAIYRAITSDLIGDRLPLLALEVTDDLADVFTETKLDIPKLMDRYKAYLVRLEAAGINPWKDQPRRSTDMQLQESVGHFHLYAWLRQAVGRECIIAAEFPTGNGKVDLHLEWNGHRGLIEVKSFINQRALSAGLNQAADYARKCGLDAITVAVFMPVKDKAVLEKISGTTEVNDVEVTVVAIGWL